ncbi:DUF6893 family small protein [Streptomyces sp. NPDC059874]
MKKAVLGAVGAVALLAVLMQLPDIKRYLHIRSM